MMGTVPNMQIEENMALAARRGKKRGWKKELNLVKWGDNNPKYDIRDWDEKHEKMGKGVTFTKEELEELKPALNELL